LIDARIVDEYGVEMAFRKMTPEDWNALYKKHKQDKKVKTIESSPNVSSTPPSKFRQFFSYTMRDYLSKISNLQYVTVNLLIAPVLALFLSFFIKYFDWMEGVEQYTYLKNENIPQYIFIAVIVSIFLGLTISAEEINKDKKILAREKFINLSRQSYLLSKVTILFGISAVQTLLFVLIGNSILEIKGMWLEYWFVLFSTACVSNLAGLNISSAFNSAKVIYIIVPLIIIPQLLFSGVIVKFDKLHPSLSNATKVPLVGNVMISRWAYEALTVEQASQNYLVKHYFENQVEMSKLQWKKDYWIPEIKSQINVLLNYEKYSEDEQSNAFTTLRNEIIKEDAYWENLSCDGCLVDLNSKSMSTMDDFKNINKFINLIRAHAVKHINTNIAHIEYLKDSIGIEAYRELKSQYINESLDNLLTNRMEDDKIIVTKGELFQNDDPIYNNPKNVAFFNAHFYAPYKYLFGSKTRTYPSNLLVIWAIAILTYILLYYDVLRIIIVRSVRLTNRMRTKKSLLPIDKRD